MLLSDEVLSLKEFRTESKPPIMSVLVITLSLYQFAQLVCHCDSRISDIP